jgi:DNA repair protein RadC
MHPLFPDDETIWPASNTQVRKQEQALREAIAPYLCLADLRRLAASGEDIQASLRSLEDVPEEVQALVRLLQVLMKPPSDERIMRPADMAALLMLEMGHLDHEEFWEVCLDTKNHVQRIQPLYRGSLNSAIVRVGELFRLPLLLNSASIIVAHNHPSNTIEASPEDIEATRSIVQAGELLQVEVLDHLIISQGSWLSMREQRLGW